MSDDESKLAQDDSEQVEVRRQKLAKLKDGGVAAYPNDFKPSLSISAIRARYEALDDAALASTAGLSIAGRIMAVRRMGKASFFHIQDRRGKLQIYAKQDQLGEKDYGLLRT